MSTPHYSPLKPLFLAALLWLPLAFFLWFYFAGVVVWPTAQMVAPVLAGALPEIFVGAEQFQFVIEVQTRVMADPRLTGGRVAALDLTINPMIYGYGLPLLAGLVMATPLSAGRRTLQIAVGFLAITLVMLWGAVWQALKMVRFDLGAQGQALIEGSGISENLIALCYQFGYLILPAVTPVALWIVMNRSFLEELVGDKFRKRTKTAKRKQAPAPAPTGDSTPS